MKNQLTFTFLSMAIIAGVSLNANAAQTITIQGRLLNTGGTPVSASSVQFRTKIRSAGVENCVMYDETQTLNLSQTQGAFAITVGNGTRASSTVDGGNSLDLIFSNSKTISLALAPTACASGASYLPGISDTRKIEISFNDGTGWDSIPTIPLAWVPQALYAQDAGKLVGIAGSQFLSVAMGTTPAPLTAGAYTNLTNLVSTAASSYYVNGGNSFGVLAAIGTKDAYDLNLKTSDIARMTITSAGLVGVGTSTPQATLDVNGFIKLQKLTAPPATCDLNHDGAIALASNYRFCVCRFNGSQRGLVAKWSNGDNTTYKTIGGATLAYQDISNEINWPDITTVRPTGVNSSYMNVVWTGFITADVTGMYTFYTTSDDGSRLYVNGTMIVDNWFDQGPTERSGTISLVAGTIYPFKVEYYQGTGGGMVNAQWLPPAGVKAIIPVDHMSTPAANGWYFMEGSMAACTW